MFGMLESLAKAAVAVVATPVAVVADVAEAAGILEDSGKSHTEEMLGAVVENIEDAVDPRK